MQSLEIALPVALLVLSFCLKLLIDRTATLPFFIEAVLELPVDIAFLATSLVIAFTIGTPGMVKEGLFAFTLYVIGSIVVVLLWRRSRGFFEKEKLILSLLLAIVNYGISVAALVYSIGLVIRK